MEVLLTSQMEAFVKEAVATGQFGSEQELVHVALSELKSRQQAEDKAFTQLREAVDAGIQQLNAGMAKPLNINAVKAKARNLQQENRA